MSTNTYDLVVVGLGGLGSSTCWHAARRGLAVLGLEQFELGHDRGASHDTSRILRHSYHTPAYVDLTFAAYDDWADLEAETGEQLVTVTGGVDLFPADGAIPMVDYTTSMDARAVPYEVLDVAAVADRWPQFHLPDGHRGAVPGAHRHRAGRPRHRSDAAAGAAPRRRAARLCPGRGARAAGRWRRRRHGRRHRVARRASSSPPMPGPRGCSAPLGHDLPLTVIEEQVTYFTPTSS